MDFLVAALRRKIMGNFVSRAPSQLHYTNFCSFGKFWKFRSVAGQKNRQQVWGNRAVYYYYGCCSNINYLQGTLTQAIMTRRGFEPAAFAVKVRRLNHLTNEPRYKSLCGAEAEAGRITCEATLRRVGLGHLRQRCAYTCYSRREESLVAPF